MPTIAVVGSIITDLAVLTPRVPTRGENILAHRLKIGPGGKGANAAVAAARLGASSLLVGRIGDDYFGREELAALRAEGVNTDAVSIDPEVQTGAAIVMVDDEGENTILVIIGANDRLTPEDVESGLAPHWGHLDAVLINFEIPPAAIAAAVNAAYAHGVPAIVDAGPPRTFGPEVWGRATVLSPNALEAATLVGHPVEDAAAAETAARELLKGGPQAVVLKRGAAGALLVTREGSQHIPAFRVTVVDTTGAGDAFSGALTVALAEGKPFPEAVRFANAAGALTVTRVGTLPAMPTRAEVEALLASP
jgi:ribokinase